MSQISLEGISKLYRVVGPEERSKHLTTRIARGLLAPIRKLRELRSLDRFEGAAEPNVIWALKDVSFTVEQGEVIGIIGRNGAGKSTLLKILSRITRPTYGRATLKGRVSSLLEVGTGFHPELTGRENILLNGAIIGMRAQEIRRKMDAIVDYSGVEKFLDTPIKRYSSGMKVRLAFAVAAHLEPDVLVIDEVLAVGDTEFQQKCLGTMAAFGEGGRTVLFVSHNLAAVQSLCRRGIVLTRGEMRFDGPVDDALEYYLASLDSSSSSTNGIGRTHNGLTLERLEVTGRGGTAGSLVRSGEPCTISLAIAGATESASPVVLIWLSGTFDERLVLLSSRLAGVRVQPFKRGLQVEVSVDALMLMPGHYQISVALASPNGRIATWERLGAVEVHPSPDAPAIALPNSADRGVVYAKSQWNVCYDGA